MRILQRARCNTNLVDCHVLIYARSVVRIDGVRVRVEVVIRKFPKFAFVAERLVLQCCKHHFNEFFEEPAVVFVNITVFVPEPNRRQIRADLELINPTMLVTPNDSDTEASPSHVVESRNLFSNSQRVVRRGDKPT